MHRNHTPKDPPSAQDVNESNMTSERNIDSPQPTVQEMTEALCIEWDIDMKEKKDIANQHIAPCDPIRALHAIDESHQKDHLPFDSHRSTTKKLADHTVDSFFSVLDSMTSWRHSLLRIITPIGLGNKSTAIPKTIITILEAIDLFIRWRPLVRKGDEILEIFTASDNKEDTPEKPSPKAASDSSNVLQPLPGIDSDNTQTSPLPNTPTHRLSQTLSPQLMAILDREDPEQLPGLSETESKRFMEISERFKQERSEITEEVDEFTYHIYMKEQFRKLAKIINTEDALPYLHALLTMQEENILLKFKQDAEERKQVVDHFSALRSAITQESLHQNTSHYQKVSSEGFLGPTMQQLFPTPINGIQQILQEYNDAQAIKAEENDKEQRKVEEQKRLAEEKKAKKRQKEKEREKRKKNETRKQQLIDQFIAYEKEAVELIMTHSETETEKFTQFMKAKKEQVQEPYFLEAFFQHTKRYASIVTERLRDVPAEQRAETVFKILDRFLHHVQILPANKKLKEVVALEFEILELKLTTAERTFQTMAEVALQQNSLLEKNFSLIEQYYTCITQLLQELETMLGSDEERNALQKRFLPIRFTFAKIQIARKKLTSALGMLNSIQKKLSNMGNTLPSTLVQLQTHCTHEQKRLQEMMGTDESATTKPKIIDQADGKTKPASIATGARPTAATVAPGCGLHSSKVSSRIPKN